MTHQTSAAKHHNGMWHRICLWLHLAHEESGRQGLVQVWDGQRCAYRMVDLSNRDDSLWETANALANHYGKKKRRSAA